MLRAGVLALVAAALIGAACGGDDEPATTEDPRALLERSAAAMDGVRSFHFVLTFEGGAAEIVRGLQMTRAEGDYGGAENFSLQTRVRLGPIDADVGIRIVEGESWITNPLTGRWEREEISVDQLFDLSTGVTALMRSAENPTLGGTQEIDGVTTQRVNATLSSDDFTLVPGTRAGETLNASAWIGVEDALVRRLEVSGRLFDATTEGTVRLDLSRLNEPVTIEPPR